MWAFGFYCSAEYSAIRREQEQTSEEGKGDDDNNDMEESLLSATQDENVVVWRVRERSCWKPIETTCF